MKKLYVVFLVTLAIITSLSAPIYVREKSLKEATKEEKEHLRKKHYDKSVHWGDTNEEATYEADHEWEYDPFMKKFRETDTEPGQLKERKKIPLRDINEYNRDPKKSTTHSTGKPLHWLNSLLLKIRSWLNTD